MMTAADVLKVIDALEGAGISVRLDGGWAVDALLGGQTRDHDDLDAVISLDGSEIAINALAPLGYTLALDSRPTRVVLTAPDERRIDFHPVVFDSQGNAVQKGAGPLGGDAPYPASGLTGRGQIAGRAVACLSPVLLVLHHTGYQPSQKDRHNVNLLCQRFGVPLPPAYEAQKGAAGS